MTGVEMGTVLLACAVSAVDAELGDLQISPLKPFTEGLEISALKLAPMSPVWSRTYDTPSSGSSRMRERTAAGAVTGIVAIGRGVQVPGRQPEQYATPLLRLPAGSSGQRRPYFLRNVGALASARLVAGHSVLESVLREFTAPVPQGYADPAV